MWRIKWNVKRFWVGELDLDNVDLAELTKIRPGTIGEIMKDAHDSISLVDLAAICQALHRNVEEVLLLIKDTEDIEGVERDKAMISCRAPSAFFSTSSKNSSSAITSCHVIRFGSSNTDSALLFRALVVGVAVVVASCQHVFCLEQKYLLRHFIGKKMGRGSERFR